MSVKDAASKSKTNHHKVIIIGAGIAGLAAANALLANGINDFKILEARNRIGGRIISIELGTQRIELGANWIHGVLGNPIFELAMHHNLISILQTPQNRKVIALVESGKQVPFELLQEIYEAYLIFLKRCEEYFLCEFSPPDDIFSVGAHIKLEIDLYLKSISNKEEKHLKEIIFNCLLKRETCITGCHSMHEIDLLELGSYTELQGGNIVLPSGYSSILAPLKSSLPPDSVLLNCPVKTIKWKRKKAPVTSPSGLNEIPEEAEDGNDSDKTVTDEQPKASGSVDNRVQIICTTNEVFYADHVICTIPLGVLKENPKLFEPSLPDYKQESIDRLLYGTVNKIFLEYERPFLSQDISEIMLLWDKDIVDELEPTMEYLKEFWYRKIYSFTKISDVLILGWISGKEAEYMETLDDKTISEKCTELLKKFLKDPYIPHPKRCVRTSWHGQAYSKGSYTSIAVGASQEDIENIAQPLYSNPHQSKPSILFAGEHTHPNFYSTVHGAFLTGRNSAQIIYRPDSPQETVIENDSSDLSAWIQGISLE